METATKPQGCGSIVAQVVNIVFWLILTMGLSQGLGIPPAFAFILAMVGVVVVAFILFSIFHKAEDVKAKAFAKGATDTAWLRAKRNRLVEADSKSLRDAVSVFPRLDGGGALNLVSCIEYALAMTPKEYDDTRAKDDNWTATIAAVNAFAADKPLIQNALAKLESARRSYFSSLIAWRDHVPSIVPKHADPLEDSLNYQQAFDELPQASPVRAEVLNSLQELLKTAQASLRKYEAAWADMVSACDTAIAVTVQNQANTRVN